MIKNAKHLLFLSLTMFMISSCVSIEKRRYREGFFVSRASRNVSRNEFRKPKVIEGRDSLFLEAKRIEKISFPVVEINIPHNDVIVTWNKIGFERIVFERDSLKESKKGNLTSAKATKIGIKSIVLASLLIFSAFFFKYHFLATVLLLGGLALLSFALIMLTLGLILHLTKKNAERRVRSEQRGIVARRNNIPLALLFLGSIVLGGFLIAKYTIYPGIWGLLFWAGFIAAIIFLIASIRNQEVEDDRKLSGKAIQCLLWAILSACFCFGYGLAIAFAMLGGTGAMIISFGALWILAFIFAFRSSIQAQKQIKEGKYWGKFFEIAGRIIMWASAILLAIISLAGALSVTQ